jgi:hypothetical protein
MNVRLRGRVVVGVALLGVALGVNSGTGSCWATWWDDDNPD